MCTLDYKIGKPMPNVLVCFAMKYLDKYHLLKKNPKT